ncbi:GPO family capsid scaffolding protein [Serratia liquefaciens]|uniref:GPO family capsid scaffolding protein n=1 Tax=Serratia liquefaciens TaxID=614 RepID=UPI0022DDF7B2|nr:GPO family capsid scaffolding protein [Serratia liquefaciens]WBL72392.1 GPO family capsid scaffolding protein [Serratia liquefaciens]
MPISKSFRVAVEGATSDGRQIQRQHIKEMAETYNQQFKPARVNLEHYLSIFPDSTFCAYGDVLSLSTGEINDGPLKGKLALYAQVDATDGLVQLNNKRQKIFTSIEYYEKFADTNKAYLTGLAFTDNPASLGSEAMKFSSNHLAQQGLFFSAAEETTLEFETPETDKPNLLASIKAMFSKRQASDDARFIDVHQAVELVAERQQQAEEKLSGLDGVKDTIQKLTDRLTASETAFSGLETKLSTTDRSDKRRDLSTGGESAELTDC